MTTSRWRALPILLVAAFVTTLDFFIANVALPAIRADLGAGESATQLVIAGYGLAYAAGVIIAGRLGDLHGPRRVFLIGLALFTLASAACGAAPGPAFLVAARIAQGCAAALMAPQVLTLLRALYPGADGAKAFGWYGTAVGLAGVSGQVVGGALVATDLAGLGWRTCFLVNVPIGLLALATARHLLPTPTTPTLGNPTSSTSTPGNPGPANPLSGNRTTTTTPTSGSTPTSGGLDLIDASPAGVGEPVTAASGRRRGLDLVGAALLATGLVAIVFPLAHGREAGWPAWSWACLAAAVPLMAAFVARQKRLDNPLLDLSVFGNRRFVLGLAAVALLFGSSSGLSFLLALYLQDGRGLSPMASGAVFTAVNAGFFAASLCARRGTGSRLVRRLPVAGALALAAGLLWNFLAADGRPAALLPGLFVAGAGMGLVMSPLLSMVLASVRQAHAGAAAGVLGTVQEVGGVLGVTVVGLVFFGALDATGWTNAARAGLAVLVVAALGASVLIWRLVETGGAVRDGEQPRALEERPLDGGSPVTAEASGRACRADEETESDTSRSARRTDLQTASDAHPTGAADRRPTGPKRTAIPCRFPTGPRHTAAPHRSSTHREPVGAAKEG
ncbi:MFS transporter [Nonomuraea sp. NPDC059194]|uniref:MFS transporter n=1 Tax=Nonomuraea sp. NPDC059194 TaxID=3346764 RepID=UPI0036A54DB5